MDPTAPDVNAIAQYVSAHPEILLLLIWSFIWKGIALWKSARLSHKRWFIAILIINTIGLLEIFYIYFVARKYKVTQETEEVKEVEVVEK